MEASRRPLAVEARKQRPATLERPVRACDAASRLLLARSRLRAESTWNTMRNVSGQKLRIIAGAVALLSLGLFAYILPAGQQSAAAGTVTATNPPPAATPRPQPPTAKRPGKARVVSPPPGSPWASYFRRHAAACIARMHDRAPHAQGMLALSLRLARSGAERVVVDEVSPTEDNELEDAELLDCLAEGSLSVMEPPASLEHRFSAMVEPRGH